MQIKQKNGSTYVYNKEGKKNLDRLLVTKHLLNRKKLYIKKKFRLLNSVFKTIRNVLAI